MAREQLTGEEFIAKYLEGRRDFHGIELPYNTDLTARVEEFNQAYDPDNRLVLYNSTLQSLIAPRIRLVRADLKWVDLKFADLKEADLSKADLMFADLRWADISRVNLSGVDLMNIDFRWAKRRGVDLSKAAFSLSDAIHNRE